MSDDIDIIELAIKRVNERILYESIIQHNNIWKLLSDITHAELVGDYDKIHEYTLNYDNYLKNNPIEAKASLQELFDSEVFTIENKKELVEGE